MGACETTPPATNRGTPPTLHQQRERNPSSLPMICRRSSASSSFVLAAPTGGEVRVHVLGRWPRSVMTRDLAGPGHRVFGMARKGPTDQDGAEAVRRLLSGLARGEDVLDLAAAIEELHPRHDTSPAEVFIRLSAGALEVAGVGRDDPVSYPGLRENTWASASSRAGRTARSSSRSRPARQPVAGSSRICPARWPGGRPTTSGGTRWLLRLL